MIIEIFKERYDCVRNYSVARTTGNADILKKLNSIIEWDLSKFPKVLKEGGNPGKEEDWEENREFFGDVMQLQPGHVFNYDGQILSIDLDNQLVLCKTSTGPGALDRIVDLINWEHKYMYNESPLISEVSFEEDIDVAEGCLDVYQVPYEKMKLWRDKVITGRFPGEGLNLKITIESDYVVSPAVFTIQDWQVAYNTDTIDEELIGDIVDACFGKLYRDCSRIV